MPGYLVDEVRKRIRSRREAMQLQTRVIDTGTIGQGELVKKVKTKIKEIRSKIKNRIEQRGASVVFTPPSPPITTTPPPITTPATVVTPVQAAPSEFNFG